MRVLPFLLVFGNLGAGLSFRPTAPLIYEKEQPEKSP